MNHHQLLYQFIMTFNVSKLYVATIVFTFVVKFKAVVEAVKGD
jgi:hypothetical protein